MFIRVISLLALLSYSPLSFSVVGKWDGSCKNVFTTRDLDKNFAEIKKHSRQNTYTSGLAKNTYVLRDLDKNLTKLKKHTRAITHTSNAAALTAGTHLILALRDSLTITEAIIFLGIYGPLASVIKATDQAGLDKIKTSIKYIIETAYPNQFKGIDFNKIYDEASINRAWIGDPGKRILGLILVSMSVTSLAVYQTLDILIFTLLGGTLGVSGYISDKKFQDSSIKNFKDKLSDYLLKLESKDMNPTNPKLQIADFDNSTKPK